MILNKEILSFIEEIMIKYGSENYLIEDDPLLKNKLSETKDLSERTVIKLIFGKKIKEQKMAGKSLEDILPSMRLKRILEELVNKKLSFKDLPELIKKELHTEQLIADEIEKLIENNAEIINLINNPIVSENIEEELEDESTKKINTENIKSIGSELLK